MYKVFICIKYLYVFGIYMYKVFIYIYIYGIYLLEYMVNQPL